MSPLPLIGRALRRATARLRPVPDFVVIGTMRAATTSLFDVLAAHPDVAPSSRKEVHFADLHFHRGEHWYRAFFPLLRRGRTIGEATPAYLAHPAAAANLASVCPEAKLIVVLRDPVDRAISHHAYRRGLGYEDRPLRNAIADEVGLEAEGFETLGADIERVRDMPYLASGRYAEQLRRWLQYFDRSQLLILDYADLLDHPAATYAEICDFLSIRQTEQTLPRVNASSATEVDAALRARIEQYFAGPNLELDAMLDRAFAWATGPQGLDRPAPTPPPLDTTAPRPTT